ncbi:uncharacterized protein LY89DRAFT_778568 [Mollisia scopiformis]|uniref:Uncharacterized protein n=1 Tax=Mollisia scopiformis TaxID=149040 RepID=A0A194XMC8_MOLSC|nr:uncharacterized protein LY89DRAFT_778568 [Mollisia scopiformis]KUJ20922.1 hypothetical protein LY89DRAFT_778568 [Mollisia scopiformis]
MEALNLESARVDNGQDEPGDSGNLAINFLHELVTYNPEEPGKSARLERLVQQLTDATSAANHNEPQSIQSSASSSVNHNHVPNTVPTLEYSPALFPLDLESSNIWRSSPSGQPLFKRTFVPEPDATEPITAAHQSKRPRVDGGKVAGVDKPNMRKTYVPQESDYGAAYSSSDEVAPGSLSANSPVPSRRRSRLLMKEIYKELEVTPHEYLELQNAAKDYMLDPQHPDRLECVGSKVRKPGLTKMKLHQCTLAFLRDEGWGDYFWGSEAPGASLPDRKLIWPEKSNRIISAIGPLLRRVISNQRQKQYGKAQRQKKVTAATQVSGDEVPSKSAKSTPQLGYQHAGTTTASNAPIDLDPALSNEVSPASQPEEDSVESTVNNTHHSTPPTTEPSTDTRLKLHLNLLHGKDHHKPKILLVADVLPTYEELVEHVHQSLNNGLHKPFKMMILGPNGLVAVRDDYAFQRIVQEISKLPWMDGDVKCLMQMADIY